MSEEMGVQDRLTWMFHKQEELQRNAYGKSPLEMEDDEERVQFIKDMVLAAEDELHEALAEVGWKPWATSRHINEEAFKGELVDLFHFFMNLCLVVKMTPQELHERYAEKRERNIKRQQRGYDGIAGKCMICRRDFEDVAKAKGLDIKQVIVQPNPNDSLLVCIDCNTLAIPGRMI
jgi:dimeric dUTPase (all-alpha-NTP-PPase superfamily)